MKVKKYIILLVFIASISNVLAFEVPSELEFGGLRLKLTEAARRKLSADVDRILSGKKGFQTKVERANLYFPIIERIFKEESLPDDFKFLSLQESALISDVVSSSNAVGYWQFKKETAIEVGLRVDHEADERMNIVASSRGAAKYIKKNNSLYFKNWIYSLLAYNMGAGGAKSQVKEKYIDASKMEIDDDMHWYVMTFLAHKLAYQDAVGKDLNPPLILVVYENCKGKSLHEIAKETEISSDNLQVYNKWVLKGKVPDDKDYFILLPVSSAEKEKILANNNTKIKVEDSEEKVKVKKGHNEIKIKIERKDKGKKEIEYTLNSNDIPLITLINGVKAIRAREGDNLAKLASAAGLPIEEFLRYNDLKSFDQVKPGEYYYLQLKRSKALVFFHTVQYDETLEDISQKYGIRIDAIRKKNRLGKKNNPPAGMVLWLRKKRPENIPIEIKEVHRKEEVKKVIPEKTVPVKDTIQVVVENKTDESIVDSIDAGQGYHIVKQGETLFGISRIYATPVDSIKKWNAIEYTGIKTGQKLLIKKEFLEELPQKNNYITHTVEQGETLYKISRTYGVTVQEIQLWNNKVDLNVSIGEKLLIKSNSK